MIFDLIILLVIIGAGFVGYKFGTSKELYRLAKIFIGLTLAGAYGDRFGQMLTSIGLLRANDWAVLSLVGFILLFILYWVAAYFLEKLFVSMELHKSIINRYLGLVSNVLQALLVVTFVSFMSTQLSFTKKSYKEYLVTKSFSYIYMDRLCRKVVTASFVNSIMNGDSPDSTKDLLIKTLGDAKIIQQITK